MTDRNEINFLTFFSRLSAFSHIEVSFSTGFLFAMPHRKFRRIRTSSNSQNRPASFQHFAACPRNYEIISSLILRVVSGCAAHPLNRAAPAHGLFCLSRSKQWRTKVYGRTRPPGGSYIFAAALVNCGHAASRHIVGASSSGGVSVREASLWQYATVSTCHWIISELRSSLVFLILHLFFRL